MDSNRIQESEQLTIKITKSTKLFTTVKNGKKKTEQGKRCYYLKRSKNLEIFYFLRKTQKKLRADASRYQIHKSNWLKIIYMYIYKDREL